MKPKAVIIMGILSLFSACLNRRNMDKFEWNVSVSGAKYYTVYNIETKFICDLFTYRIKESDIGALHHKNRL